MVGRDTFTRRHPERGTTLDECLSRPPVLDWLEHHGLRGLPETSRLDTSATGRVVVHRPDGCSYANSLNRGPAYGNPSEAFVCGCFVEDIVGDMTVEGFFRALRVLVDGERLLERSLDGGYAVEEGFPQLAALAVRHHRWYAARRTPWPGLFDAGALFASCPALEEIRKGIVAAWDAAQTAHPVDTDALREEVVRYVVREEVAHHAFKRFNALGLQVSNALQQLIWRWLSRPTSTTLLDEFYSERGDVLRKLAGDPVAGSGFSLGLIDDLDAHAARLIAHSTPTACCVSSPDIEVPDIGQGPRPLIVWSGLKTRSGSVAFGEHPLVVSEWLVRQQERPDRFARREPGVRVTPICASPGLEPYQWDTAITLWTDSLTTDAQDPGPYRDQATAIHAAATL